MFDKCSKFDVWNIVGTNASANGRFHVLSFQGRPAALGPKNAVHRRKWCEDSAGN